jgi:hypothetical protein
MLAFKLLEKTSKIGVTMRLIGKNDLVFGSYFWDKLVIKNM